MSLVRPRRKFPLFVVLIFLAGSAARSEVPKAPPHPAPTLDLAQLKAQALEGTADAKLELAIAYDLGQAAPRDAALAAEWYRQAATLQSPEAELRLGMLAETGDGVVQSYDEARQHYERALALGLAEANLRLGILYLEGWGVPRDPAEAMARIRLAAEADYRPAQRVLSDMYAVGVGIKADRQEALAWAQRAARADDAAAQVSVGHLLLNRLSREEDLKLAREWYQLSVEQEYTRGMLSMAATFLRPGLTAEDRAIGRGWLQLAAESGNSAAAFYLAGMMLFDAQAKNESAARGWLEQAASAGEYTAREVLELAAGGKPLAEAFKYVMTVPGTSRYLTKHNASLQTVVDKADPTSRLPLLVKMTDPVYPMALRLTETTGQVLIDFIVDTSGRVRNPRAVKTTHPAFSERAVEAVRAWRFSPGVRNGRVVNTHMQVPVYFTLSDVHPGRKPRGGTGDKPDTTGDKSEGTSSLPTLISQTLPVYPKEMMLTGTTGEVLVDFIVDTNGRVTDARAVKTTHSAFSASAVEAVRSWQFSPGTRNGQAVDTHMQVPVSFTLSDVPSGQPPEARTDAVPRTESP